MVVVARVYFHAQKCSIMRQVSGCDFLCDCCCGGQWVLGCGLPRRANLGAVCVDEVDYSDGGISVVKRQ